MTLHPVAIAAMAAMGILIVVSNIVVEIPINDWLTWGALTYPVCFLVTDLTNRRLGAQSARRVVYVGFAIGVVMSLVFANERIAIASGSAFLIAQLLDIGIFDRLRRASWWQAPLASSLVGSAVDTALFFSLAFAFTGLPWVTWAVGDFGVKVAVAMVMLVPFRLLMPSLKPA
jgi:queuosine precursor transporter